MCPSVSLACERTPGGVQEHDVLQVDEMLSDDRLAAPKPKTLATLQQFDASAWEIEAP